MWVPCNLSELEQASDWLLLSRAKAGPECQNWNPCLPPSDKLLILRMHCRHLAERAAGGVGWAKVSRKCLPIRQTGSRHIICCMEYCTAECMAYLIKLRAPSRCCLFSSLHRPRTVGIQLVGQAKAK